MAILKDLIVHGPSRFLNGINVDAVHANLIDAHNGVFKTITTTTLDAETITTDMLNATNARVSQTLTVDGTISTNKWEAASIANIGGNFYISPTGKSDSGNITITKTSTTTINGVSVGVYTLVVGSTSFGVTSTSSTIWGPTSSNQSKVIFTGSIAYSNSKKYPLGTCNGTMTALSVGTNTLTGFTITGVNSPALDIFFKELGITSVSNIACNGYEMQISVYQSYSNSALRPIGILLTSYGKEKRQYIDIYNGENQLGDSSTGFADPAVRIGLLDGLPNIVTNGSSDTLPVGWGIYTTNGFFKGKIVANAGKIGNWTIEQSTGNPTYNGAIYTGTFNSSGGIFITPGYTTTINIGGSTGSNNKIWTITAGQNFGLTTAGVLYAKEAHISGEITATEGTIGGCSISNGVLQVANANITSIDASKINAGNIAAERMQTNLLTALNTDITNLTSTTATIGSWTISKGVMQHATVGGSGGVWISADTDTSSNVTVGNSGAIKTWRLLINNTFGVTTAGKLYASGADIGGKITASDGQIGPWFINSTSISRNANGNAVGSYNTASNLYFGTSGISLSTAFRVDSSGNLTATGATLKGITIQNTNGNKVISIGASGLQVFDNDGYLRADYSGSTTLYGGNSSTGTNPKAIVNSNGLELYNSSGTKTSVFGTDIVLGQNNATIKLGLPDNGNGVLINSSGLDVRYQGLSKAFFGMSNTPLARLGCASGEAHLIMNGTGLHLYDSYDHNYLKCGVIASEHEETLVAHVVVEMTDSLTANIVMSNTYDGSFGYNYKLYYNDTIVTNSTNYYTYSLVNNTLTVTCKPAIAGGSWTTGDKLNFVVVYSDQADSTAQLIFGSHNASADFGPRSTTLGTNCIASGTNSFSIGIECIANGPNSFAANYHAKASGNYAHAEGSYSEASGPVSHAEGISSIANETASHAEGYYCISAERATHAEGYMTSALGRDSHAEGNNAVAHGSYSHAQGYYTIANGYCETTIGQYNILSNSTAQISYNTTNSPYILVLGNGTSSSARSNAMTVNWGGNLWTKGTITATGNISTSGTITATGKLTAGAINNDLFVVESKTFSYDTTYGTGNQEKTTAAWTKSGYYPIGVVGFSVDQAGWVVRRCYLTSVGAGTCKVYFNIRNTLSNQYAITFTAYVLWIKITA